MSIYTISKIGENPNTVSRFDYIYNSTNKSVLAFITAKCRHTADIGDIFQDTYMELYQVLTKREADYIKKENGYYYHDYRDKAYELHRVYIVKNNGEAEMERWYSQFEWLPKRGVGFGRGFTHEMTCVVTFAEDYAAQGADDLDTILQYYLNKYWTGTFVSGEDNRYIAPEE